jgi:hypothetical protein
VRRPFAECQQHVKHEVGECLARSVVSHAVP